MRAAWPALAGIDFERGQLFTSADADEVHLACCRLLGDHHLRVLGTGSAVRARMSHLPLGPLSLSRLAWGAPVAVEPALPLDYYLITVPTRGQAQALLGGVPSVATPAMPAIAGGGQPFRFETSADFEQILLRLDRASVERGWAALSGEPPTHAIVFADAMPADGPAWQALAPPLAMLARAASDHPAPPAWPHLHARLEDLIVTTLLLQQPHSAALPAAACQPAAPAVLRRAEAWLRGHLGDGVTLGTLAQACGVPGRTLQTAFQRAHGMGPMQWLRLQRLDAVREALLATGEGRGAVSHTALQFGFSHLGEFSQAYRRRFGETPSRTAAKRR